MFLFHDKCLFCKHFCLFVLFFKQRYLHFCLCNHPCCMQQLCKEELAKNRAPPTAALLGFGLLGALQNVGQSPLPLLNPLDQSCKLL